MALVERGQIDVVVMELPQPAVRIPALELLDVGYDVCLVQIGAIRRRSSNIYRLGIRRAGYDGAPRIEHGRVCRVEIPTELLFNAYTRSDHESVPPAKSEPRYRDAAGLAASDRQDHGEFALALLLRLEDCSECEASVALWRADTFVVLDVWLAILKWVGHSSLYSG